MNTPSHEIARRVALRLAQQNSDHLALPAYVERTIAGVLVADEAGQRTPSAMELISFAGLLVNIAALNWAIYQANKPKADALNATELALVRKQLAENIDSHPQFLAQASREVRSVLVEALVDETIAEGHRLPPKAPAA